jgi:hypothetical protein
MPVAWVRPRRKMELCLKSLWIPKTDIRFHVSCCTYSIIIFLGWWQFVIKVQ